MIDLRRGDCRALLPLIQEESIDCCITSPPYYGLRDYGTASWNEGDPDCKHEGDGRFYTENTAALSSSDAFSKPGQANADRLRRGRWRERGVCVKCGALHDDPQLGLEATPELYISDLVAILREVRRALKPEGTLFLNLGDSYNAYNANRGPAAGANKNHHEIMPTAVRGLTDKNLKNKDLIGIPWMAAFALRADGWYLRQDIIWAKPNPMPESVTDRCTKSHEYLFLLSKSSRYYFDAKAISEPVAPSSIARLSQPGLEQQRGSDRVPGKTNGPMKAAPPRFGGNKYGNSAEHENRTKSGNEYEIKDGRRNRRSVWTVATQPFGEAHFATFPEALIEPAILAGCPVGGTVLDPFMGSGTTGIVSIRNGRKFIGLELNPEYLEMARRRISAEAPLFSQGGE